MKRFTIGLLVGMFLMTGIVGAAQVIGQHADFKIMVNGQQKQLSNQPVVIDGSTYLPVRALAQLLGYNVDFNPNDGQILLNNKPVSQPVSLRSSIINKALINWNGNLYELNTWLPIKAEDQQVFVKTDMLATLIGIDNDNVKRTDAELPGGIAGYINSPVSAYCNDVKQYYDVNDLNSKYFVDYTFTNPQSQKTWFIRRDESEVGSILNINLSELFKLLEINAVYSVNADNTILTVEFK